MKIFFNQSTQGFTLVEAMVAISILLMTLVGSMNLVVQSISSSILAKNQVMAFNLSQEAVEFVRNTKDTNILQGGGDNWLFGLDPCLDSKKCVVDSPNNIIAECSSGGCPVLRFDPSSSLYGYETSGSWSDSVSTLFTREVFLERIEGSSDEITLTIVISWKEGSLMKNFSIKESLFKRI